MIRVFRKDKKIQRVQGIEDQRKHNLCTVKCRREESNEKIPKKIARHLDAAMFSCTSGNDFSSTVRIFLNVQPLFLAGWSVQLD